jgi:hypothetical protein
MEQRTTGGDELPAAVRRRDVQAGSDQQPRASLRFLLFPEAFEILANGLEPERHAVRQIVRPSNAGDQIDGVALRRKRLLEQR